MSKIVLFGSEAREKIKKGVDLIANSIRVTLGPRGRNVAYSFWYGDPVVTKDGITVGKQISCRDQVEEMGLKLIRQAAQKTADDGGDGTTTSALLAQSIFNEGLKVLGGGANSILIKKGIDLAVAEAVQYIQQYVIKDPSESDLMRVAIISANNDVSIASVVCEAIKKAGADGVITIEDNYKDATTYIQSVEGMQLNEGYLSPYFVTNKDKMEAVYQDAYILIADYEINHIQPLMKAIEMVIGGEKKPLIIIANNISGQALETLVMNRIKAGLPIVCCKAPYFGDNRTEQLTDLAILTGGRVVGQSSGLIFDKLELNDFGRANAIATKHHTTFTAGAGQEADVKSRIGVLQASILATESDYEKEKLQERLAKLTSGVAVIRIGAVTEVELKEKKFRTEDALMASQAALEEGTVCGGGLMLLHASNALNEKINKLNLTEEEKIGWRIVVQALKAPIKQIATNSGISGEEIIANINAWNNQGEFQINYGFDFLSGQYGDLMKLGIIDPFKVIRLTITNAASVAGTLLTTEVCICDEAEEEISKTPRSK